MKRYEKELKIALAAISQVITVASMIQTNQSRDTQLAKEDRSPVTVADFAVQALVCYMLNQYFPDLPIVAEESSAKLSKPENRDMLNQVIEYCTPYCNSRDNLTFESLSGLIDRGQSQPGEYFWTLDPIDGTKGFLRGEQYAIALALIRSGRVEIGVLGCPNLQINCRSRTKGFIFYAVRGHGTYMVVSDGHNPQKLKVSKLSDPTRIVWAQSYESAHSHSTLQSTIARELSIKKEPIRMDSQAKYALVASGAAELYLRIPNPKTPDYKEKIWDHAAGVLLVEEAGGVVTDIQGKELDFSQGKLLNNNNGVLVTTPNFQERLLTAISRLSGI